MGATTSLNEIPIDDILNKILNDIPELPAKTRAIYYNNGKNLYKIPYDKYIQQLYWSITDDSLASTNTMTASVGFVRMMYDFMVGFEPSPKSSGYLSTIYKYFVPTPGYFNNLKSCILFIEINVLLETNKKYIKYFNHIAEISEDIPLFQHICSALVSDIKNCGSFTAISVRICNENDCHANIIFVENVNNVMVFNYYEPHGSYNQAFSFSLGIVEILEKIKNVISKSGIQVVINNKTSDSCPRGRGMQYVTREYDSGYCVIFSMLWIYSVLHIINYMIKNNDYRPSNEWIQKVELFYTDNNKIQPINLYNKVVGFGSMLFNLFIETDPEHSKRVLNKLYSGISTEELKEYIVKDESEMNEYNTKYNSDDSERIQYLENLYTESGNENIFPEDTMEEYEKELEEQKSRRILNKRILNKKVLGEKCKRDTECISKCCLGVEDIETGTLTKECAREKDCTLDTKNGKAIKTKRRYSPYF